MRAESERPTGEVTGADGIDLPPPASTPASTPVIVPTVTPTIPWAIGFLPLLYAGKGWGCAPSRQDKEAGR